MLVHVRVWMCLYIFTHIYTYMDTCVHFRSFSIISNNSSKYHKLNTLAHINYHPHKTKYLKWHSSIPNYALTSPRVLQPRDCELYHSNVLRRLTGERDPSHSATRKLRVQRQCTERAGERVPKRSSYHWLHISCEYLCVVSS